MSRDSFQVCGQCGVFQFNGDGVGLTMLDYCRGVEQFDADVAEHNIDVARLSALNKNVRAFLVRHAGHADISHHSSDWNYDGDPLDSLTEERWRP